MTQYNANNLPASQYGADKGVTYAIYSAAAAAQLHQLFRREVYLTYGSGLISGWSEIYGRNSTIAGMDIIHLEQDRFQFPLTVQTTNTGNAAGALVTVTITAGSLAGGVDSPVTDGFTVYNQDGKSGTIMSVPAANQFTVRPNDGTYAFDVTAGQNLVFSPVRLVTEGSVMGNSGFRYPPVQFRSKINTLRMDLALTDEDLYNLSAENAFWNWVDPATGAQYTWYANAAIKECETKFFNGRELYYMNNELITNTALTTAGYRGTGGILPTQKNFGTTINYVGAIGLQMTDFQRAAIAMEKNNSSMEYLCYGGIEFNIGKDNCMHTFFPNGGIQYAAFGGDKDVALNMGFKSLYAYGRTWHFNNNPIFSNPSYFGANGWNYIGESLCIPAGDTMTADGMAVKHIEVIRPTRSKGYRQITTDGTNVFIDSPTPNSNSMRSIFTFVDDCGMEIWGAKHLMYFGRK